MLKLKPIIITLIALFLCDLVSAQLKTEPYALLFLQERVQVEENIQNLSPELSPNPSELVQGKYYRLIQFYQLPNIAELAQLERAGIELLDYIPNKAYLASFPAGFELEKLRGFNVRSVSKWNKAWKASQVVLDHNFDEWARNGEWLSLAVRYHKNVKSQYAESVFQSQGITVLKAPDFMNLIHIRINASQLDWLLEHPMVNFVNQIPGPGKKESDRGRSMHKSNMLDAATQMGRHYDGSGISVLVRDDGALGPHIDFQGRLTEFSNDWDIFETHGDGVAGIACGAGNLDPDQRGMAAGATLYNKDYVADFLDTTLDLHLNNEVVLTNSSYSNGCNRGYTEITETVDRQVYENPTLMHVFSAGNDGSSNCDYGAGAGWGNITGGHKQGKNVIATGNLGNIYLLENSSSRGPAYDGRIKPDICAHGAGHVSTAPNNEYMNFGGTSAAAPGIMGVMAQLYQAYRELNGGEMPESSLMKGILLNSANDMQNLGPDFRTGWGRVNALRAVQILEEKRYLKDNIDPGQQKTHQIEVPANIRQVRFMLYWADPQAAPTVEKSLINDLNFKGISPGGVETLPWILDPTPNASALNQPAERGIDNLNNMEQVLIDNPEEGTYELVVDGFELPFGNHPYHIIYEFVRDEITVTYPNGGEGWIPGREEQITWDGFATDDDYILDYSVNGGVDWINIATIASTGHFYNWDVPDMHGYGEVLIRVSNGTYSDTNDEYFSIATPPINVRIDAVCPASIRLAWDSTDMAEAYDIFILGDKYMDSVAQTTDVFYEIPVTNPADPLWVAVRARGANDFVSQRTIAIPHNFIGFVNCVVNNNVAAIGVTNSNNLGDCGVVQDFLKVRIQNKGEMDQTNFNVSYQIDNDPIVSALFTDTLAAGTIETFEFPMPFSITEDGAYEIFSWVDLLDDELAFDDTTSRTINATVYNDPTDAGLIEDFESADFPPNDWKLRNADNSITWVLGDAIQVDGSFGKSAVFRNTEYMSNNQKDELISFPVDLSNATFPVLTFDRAYALPSFSTTDRLQVQVFSDCGNTSEGIIYDSNLEGLKTVETKLDLWAPTEGEDWAQEILDLSEFIGKNIVVKFINTTRRSNNLYLDNINIGEYAALPVANFSADNIICVDEKLTFDNQSEGLIATYAWDFGVGAEPATSTKQNPDPVSWSQAGTPEISLIVSNGNGVDSFKQQIVVEALPIPDFSYVNDNGVVSFSNTSTSTSGLTYLWDFGDGNTSTEMNPVHTYAMQDSFDVSLTVESDVCGSVSKVIKVGVLINTSVDDLASEGFAAQVVPNPNEGRFVLQIEDFSARDIEVTLFDVLGKRVYMEKIKTFSGSNTYPLEMTDLPSGVFFLNLKSEGLTKTIKVMME